MKYTGGTFSGIKLVLCVPKFWVIGHCCTYEGRIANETKVTAIKNWGPCNTLSEVQAFLGTIGVLRIFIHNFTSHAHHLVKLTRKDAIFEFGLPQLQAQDDLKQAIITLPAL